MLSQYRVLDLTDGGYLQLCPHGVFPTRGDDCWIAIAAHVVQNSDECWARTARKANATC